MPSELKKLTDYNSYELSAGDDAAVFYAIPAPVALAAQAVMDAAAEVDGDLPYSEFQERWTAFKTTLAAYEEACK